MSGDGIPMTDEMYAVLSKKAKRQKQDWHIRWAKTGPEFMELLNSISAGDGYIFQTQIVDNVDNDSTEYCVIWWRFPDE